MPSRETFRLQRGGGGCPGKAKGWGINGDKQRFPPAVWVTLSPLNSPRGGRLRELQVSGRTLCGGVGGTAGCGACERRWFSPREPRPLAAPRVSPAARGFPGPGARPVRSWRWDAPRHAAGLRGSE